MGSHGCNRTHVQQIALATEYKLSPEEVLILKTWSHGLEDESSAEVLGFTLWMVNRLTPGICRKLKSKTNAHAVANALRIGIIS